MRNKIGLDPKYGALISVASTSMQRCRYRSSLGVLPNIVNVLLPRSPSFLSAPWFPFLSHLITRRLTFFFRGILPPNPDDGHFTCDRCLALIRTAWRSPPEPRSRPQDMHMSAVVVMGSCAVSSNHLEPWLSDS